MCIEEKDKDITSSKKYMTTTTNMKQSLTSYSITETDNVYSIVKWGER